MYYLFQKTGLTWLNMGDSSTVGEETKLNFHFAFPTTINKAEICLQRKKVFLLQTDVSIQCNAMRLHCCNGHIKNIVLYNYKKKIF